MTKPFQASKKVEKFVADNGHLHVSYGTGQGERDTMEDRMDIRVVNKGLLLTICDGHAGDACANYTIKEYPKQAAHCLATMQPLEALQHALTTVHTTWDTMSSPSARGKKLANDGSGTTLCVCYLDTNNRQVHVLNLGDSRVQYQHANGILHLTPDHKPRYRDAVQVTDVPIFLQLDDGTLRINGDLAVGRTIGDNTPSLQKCVSRKPFTVSFSYTGVLKLIAASDGLWDEVEPHEVFGDHRSCADFIKHTSDNIVVIYVIHDTPRASYV